MKYKFKSALALIALWGVSFFSAKAQLHINGPFAILDDAPLASFGNLSLGASAQLIFMDGSTLHMLGTATTIDPNAQIFANTTSSQTGTGRILFQGSTAQTLNGGNSSTIGGAQPSFINIAIENPNNLTLVSSNSRITSGVDFITGHVLLGNQNLELATAADITNADENRYFVTNGSGFLAKESIPSSTAFNFPIGRATADYTPAVITPAASDNFFAQVKNYSESASDEFVTTDGVDRTWNIFSTNGSGADISLQHNPSTSGTAFNPADAFVTQYQGLQTRGSSLQGVWQVGIGANGASTSGTPSTSSVRVRSYTATATSASASGAFFSKSSNILTPLPVTLLEFQVHISSELQSLVTWATSSEVNSDFFEVETSTDGNLWEKIGKVKAQGFSNQMSEYKFIHTNPSLGINYYRLNAVDIDGTSELSLIRMIQFGKNLANNVAVYPNPTNGVLYVAEDGIRYNYTLLSADGKFIADFKNNSESGVFSMDLNNLANGIYHLKAISNLGEFKTFKIVVNK